MNIINHTTTHLLKPTFCFLAAAIFAALALFSPAARASSITWGSAQNITGDSNVSTDGSLIGAYNVGNTGVSSATVNGVNFQSFAVPNNSNGGTVGNFTISSANQLFSDNSSHGSAQAPFSGLSSGYQTMLGSGIASIFSSGFSLTMTGLTVGMQYQFQWWANNSSDSNNYPTTATAGNSVQLDSNAGHADGGLGQFALGTFTADSATQVINFTISEVGFLNAFQLRELQGSFGVPEGGDTLGLLALACGGLVILHRKLRPARTA
jgi:hypothetical protein